MHEKHNNTFAYADRYMSVHREWHTFLLSGVIGRGSEPATPLCGDHIRRLAGQTRSILVAGKNSELVTGVGLKGLHYKCGLGLLDDRLPVLETFLQHLHLVGMGLISGVREGLKRCECSNSMMLSS